MEAGEAAVAETLAWLEREACHVRRGTNNRHAKVPEAGGGKGALRQVRGGGEVHPQA